MGLNLLTENNKLLSLLLYYLFYIDIFYEASLNKRLLLCLMLVLCVCGCSFNSGRVRLLNYDLATTFFGDVPDQIRVVKGDTLYSISKRYNVPLRDLITANNLRPPYTLSVGQVLRIPSAKYHIVAKGDTLYSISKKYDVNLTSLSRLNDIDPPYTLAVGQRLALPASVGTTAAGSAVTLSGYSESQEDETGTIWISPTSSAKKSVSSAKKTSSVKKTAAKTSSKKKTTVKKSTTRSQPVKVSARKTKFAWPVQGKVISKFGSLGGGRNNDGINIQAKKGTMVRAADKGTIVYAGNELKGFGNLILLRHDGGWITAYAHNEKILVKKGQKVVRGEKIATVGNTGGVSEPQLHFEVRAGKNAVNPLKYLP